MPFPSVIAPLLWFVVASSLTFAQRSLQQQQPAAGAEKAQTAPADNEPSRNRSPWLLVPLVSSTPKLGTAVGALGAYITRFDPESKVSLFGMNYQYTSTHSSIVGAFARTSFGADHHRVVGIAAFGSINNNYEDYLGTGQPLKTNDDLKLEVRLRVVTAECA
jgi:hypothetical protein